MRTKTYTVEDGNTEEIEINAAGPCSVSLDPGAGTMTCKMKVGDGGDGVDIDPDNATFAAPAAFAVLAPITALIVTATGDDGSVSIKHQL